MPTQITVLYPQTSDATFKLDYYLSTHMPMVGKLFGESGLKGWKVAKLLHTPTGDAAPYSIQATLDFGSAAEFEAALKAHGEAVLGDIPNFSNKDPVIMVGDVVGSK